MGEHNNTYHRTIKMKPVDVKYNTYIDFKKGVNDKDPKFKVGDHDLNNSFNSWIDKEDLV